MAAFGRSNRTVEGPSYLARRREAAGRMEPRRPWGATKHGLNAEFGFEMDVCATAENAKCRKFFTPEDNGLVQHWEGVCWMNPPYGREIERWMRKALESAQQGAMVVCLVPARTDAKWWHRYAMRGEIRYSRGRLKFSNSENSAPFPNAVVIFRPPILGQRSMHA